MESELSAWWLTTLVPSSSGEPKDFCRAARDGELFEGLLPPVVAAPTFAIRKSTVAVFSLADYVAVGIMTPDQAGALRDAVRARKNILVAGGTSTGKTTLTNALLAEVAKTTDRVVLIEDTRELQCLAPNLVALRTKDGLISLSNLVRSSLRLRPIVFPLVRCAEPKRSICSRLGHRTSGRNRHDPCRNGARGATPARATGPGSCRHSPAAACRRNNLIAVLSGRGAERRLSELARVTGLGASGDYILSAIGDQS
ncbi:hypothetical protein ABIB80_004446 [Bradyrhizobium sp. i1.15.2]